MLRNSALPIVSAGNLSGDRPDRVSVIAKIDRPEDDRLEAVLRGEGPECCCERVDDIAGLS